MPTRLSAYGVPKLNLLKYLSMPVLLQLIVRKYFLIVQNCTKLVLCNHVICRLRLQCLVFASSVSASFPKLFLGFLHVYTILKLLYIIVRNSAINFMYQIWRCKLVHLTVKALCAFWIFEASVKARFVHKIKDVQKKIISVQNCTNLML